MAWMIKAAWKPSWFNEDNITFVILFLFTTNTVRSQQYLGLRCNVYVTTMWQLHLGWFYHLCSMLQWRSFVSSNILNLILESKLFIFLKMLFWLVCAVLYMQQVQFILCILPRAGSCALQVDVAEWTGCLGKGELTCLWYCLTVPRHTATGIYECCSLYANPDLYSCVLLTFSYDAFNLIVWLNSEYWSKLCNQKNTLLEIIPDSVENGSEHFPTKNKQKNITEFYFF